MENGSLDDLFHSTMSSMVCPMSGNPRGCMGGISPSKKNLWEAAAAAAAAITQMSRPKRGFQRMKHSSKISI